MLEFSAKELALLTNYQLLNPQHRQEADAYIEFLLFRQYRDELVRQVMGNPFLLSGLSQVQRMCEREDVGLDEISQKVRQLKYMYHQLLEKVDTKYQDVLESLTLDSTVRDFGRYNLCSLTEAVDAGDRRVIGSELEEMVCVLERFKKKGEMRRTLAG
jgi:hypothetical protein